MKWIVVTVALVQYNLYIPIELAEVSSAPSRHLRYNITSTHIFLRCWKWHTQKEIKKAFRCKCRLNVSSVIDKEIILILNDQHCHFQCTIIPIETFESGHLWFSEYSSFSSYVDGLATLNSCACTSCFEIDGWHHSLSNKYHTQLEFENELQFKHEWNKFTFNCNNNNSNSRNIWDYVHSFDPAIL